MYGKLMQVIGWRDSSVSMTNFITQGLESMKFRKENGLDLGKSLSIVDYIVRKRHQLPNVNS